MNYFVTGGTGFIGRFVVERLLKRPNAKVHLLVRKESKANRITSYNVCYTKLLRGYEIVHRLTSCPCPTGY